MTYEQANELLVTTMQTQNYAPDTQKKFKASLAYLCSFHNRYGDVENITVEETQDFLTHLSSEKNLSPSTVNNYQAAIKFIFESVFNRKWPDKFSYFSLSKRKGLDPNSLPHFANPGTILPLTQAILIFIQHMELRGSATTTQAAYIRSLRKFAAFCRKEDNLNNVILKDIQDFLHHQHYICDLNPHTVNTYRTALKLFYVVILDKDWHDLKVPSYKIVRTVPTVLSPNEVISLLNAMENPTYKMIGILMYSAGLRISEAIKLKISDIDSNNMQILVTEGKGHKNRYAILSEQCLLALRSYYKAYHPTNYLFPGQRYNLYVSKESVRQAVRVAALKAHIKKPVTPHTLRHCFATHLLENDTNLYHIKELLGHSSLRSTTSYLHTMSFANISAKSPLDIIGGLS